MSYAKYYKCVRDLQDTNFAVGVIATISQWRKIAINWCYSDDNYCLLRTLKHLKKEEIINFISDIWQLEFKEIISFIDDKEKMKDFLKLSKDDFLKSYNYLTEEEYNNTLEVYNKRK